MLVCGAHQELVVTEALDDPDEEHDIVVGDDVEVEEILLREEARFRAVLPHLVVERIFEDLELGGVVRRVVARHDVMVSQNRASRILAR